MFQPMAQQSAEHFRAGFRKLLLEKDTITESRSPEIMELDLNPSQAPSLSKSENSPLLAELSQRLMKLINQAKSDQSRRVC